MKIHDANLRTQVTCQWQVLKVNRGTIKTTYGKTYMVCERAADERTDDGREPKDSAECAKESWAVLDR